MYYIKFGSVFLYKTYVYLKNYENITEKMNKNTVKIKFVLVH